MTDNSLERLYSYGIKPSLSLNQINPINNPEISVASIFLSLLIQRSHVKRYLMIKTRTLSLFSFIVNYSCLYYVLFNSKEVYRKIKENKESVNNTNS
jgi:hypothetical protein